MALLKKLRVARFSSGSGWTGGLAEQNADGLVTHVLDAEYGLHPLRPEDRAPSEQLAGKDWSLNAEGYAVPADPEPAPEEEEAAPARRRK
ncbi:MAG: hypothetical protein ACKVYV_15655 [Limisphaerales bacterium]